MRCIKSIFLAAVVVSSFAANANEVEPLGRQKIASYKILAAQFAAASKASINNLQRVAEGYVATQALQASMLDQLIVYREFSPLVGQGAQVCDAINNNSDIDRIAVARTRYDIGNLSNGGRPKGDPARYINIRVKEQLDKYCTADQHNLGLCRASFDGMAGASSNFALLMRKEQFTKKDLEAANAFIANMVPPPTPTIDKGSCKSNACLQLASATRSVDAFSGMAAYSFASIFSSRVGGKTHAELKREN